MADTDTAETAGSADADAPDLGPMPEPRIEPGEPAPGGVDALPEPAVHLIPDLGVTENPALEDKAPDPVVDEVDDGEDTTTAATRTATADEAGDAEQRLEPSE
jgi:hypothetical protein